MLRAQGVCALIGALCLGMPAAAAAQGMGVGVKGGLAIASIPLSGEVFDQVIGLQSIESSSKLGVTAGGYVRFPISKLFWFQPEAMYVMKGANLTLDDGLGKFSARLHYIDVPLLLHIRIRPEQRMPGYLFGGVNFGMMVGSSGRVSGSKADADVNIEPSLKTNDVGIAFGGGIERGRFLYEARVTLGLSDIGAESYPHLDPLHNRAISLLVGRKFK